MSFAGHVFDMIRRNKENREMLNLRREHTKDARKRSAKTSSPPYESNITAKELDQIKQRSE